jgi:multisubunit Na+/H+ antiporter MnhE subunit
MIILGLTISYENIAIGFIVGLIVSLIFSFIFRRKKSIKKEIGTARANLREVYKSYGKELFSIADKIDKHLEVLENA